jgi:hypothetical protein
MRKSAFSTILLGGIVLFTGMAAAAEVRCVPGDYTTIQAAINACNNGDIVIVAAGIYTGTGNRDIDFLGKAIVVCSINPNDPCVVAATIINCQGTEENPHRGFHFHSSEDANSVLNGVTIINGYVTHDLGSAGGAICCENESSPKIINCIITGNKATSWPMIGGGSGGAVFGCNGEISNCLISKNSAMFGGGLSQCAGIIRNNIITNNKSDYLGGGLCGCDGIIQNNVISGNSAGGYGGGLAYCSGNVSNCIVWSNLPEQIHNVTTVQYSDVQDGRPGEGNIDADPCFVNPTGGNYHLSSDSLCIDAGDPVFNPTPGEVDIDGEPRVMGGCVDMGADEFTSTLTPVIGISDTNFAFSAILGGPNPGTQVLSIYNIGAGTLNWEIAEECNWLTTEPNNGSSTGEPNDVILSVNTAGLGYGTYDCNLTISDPCAANNPQLVPVELIIQECYAGMPDYDEWVAVGKPLCWCYPRQCHGDADGKKEGTASKGFQYVSSKDLDVLSACWLVKDPPKGPGILNIPPVNGVPVACADFKHSKFGNPTKGYIRCANEDLDEMSLYWLVKEPTKGSGTPADCLPGNLTP